MKRIGSLTIVLAILVTARTPQADAQGDKPPTIKEIMGKLNKGPASLCPTIGKALKTETPNWDTVDKEAKDFAVLAADLGKNNPPKGDKASWEKAVKKYADSATALEAAAAKKDKKAALAAHAALADMNTCKACHSAHRN